MRNVLCVVAVVLLAWGSLLYNGAGFSNSDDHYALGVSTTRPLLRMTYDFNIWTWRHWQTDTWMTTNVAMHMASSLALMSLAGPMAACIFAAHPFVGDAVASVSGRSSLLCAMLILLCLVSLKHRMHYAAAGLALLAFLAKEEAAALIILLPACAWSWNRPRLALGLLAGGLIAGVSGTGLLLQVSRSAGVDRSVIDSGMRAPGTPLERLVDNVTAVGYHGPKLVVPVGLGVEPPRADRVVGLVFLVAIVVAIWVVWHHIQEVRLPLAFLVAPVVVYIPMLLNDPVFEHRWYLAAAGAAWCFATLVELLPVRLMALGLFVYLSHGRAFVYSRADLLWAEAVKQNPDGVRARINYGNLLWAQDRTSEAEEQYKAAMPSRASYENLAALYVSRRDIANASLMMDMLEGRGGPIIGKVGPSLNKGMVGR